MKSYKILQVHTLPLLYGSGQAVLIMMRGARAAGYEVALACSSEPGPLPEKAEQEGFKVFRISHLHREVNLVNDILAVLELARVIKKEGFHIVHTNNSKAGIIGRFAAKLAGVPVIVHTIRGYTALYGHSFFKKILFYILKKMASIFSDKIICISASVRDWARNLHLTADSKFEVIYSAIDEDRFVNVRPVCSEIRKRYDIPEHSLIIAQISKLWEGKGLEFFIDAAAHVLNSRTDVHFLIIGDGHLRPHLEKKIEQYGIERYVKITGFIEDIENILPCIDVGILLSEFEGMGRVILEYMVSGLPIIATNVGGIPELVSNGRNGFLIEPYDMQDFIKKLNLLLSDTDLRQKFGKMSRELFEAKFSARHMNRQVLEIYRDLIKKKIEK